MKRIFLASFSAFVLACPGSAFAQTDGAQNAVTTATAPKKELSPRQLAFSELLAKGNIQGVPIYEARNLRTVYAARDYKTFWVQEQKVNRNTEYAIDILEDAWTHGLSSANYNTKLLRDMAKAKLTERQLLEFEILLSDAVARYGHDISGMRVSAKAIGEDTRSWLTGLTGDQVLNFVMSDGNVTDSLEKLAPSGRLYKAMRDDLRRLIKDIADHPDADPQKITGVGKAVYPGDTHKVIPTIRHRLGLPSKSGAANEVYDEQLVQAISKFQRANGLKPDGVIGKRTLVALNQGRKEKLVKLIANLERQRWMDPRLPDRYIVVNVPAMTLWAIDKGDIKFEMPVIVGREKRPTNSFITNISGIRFNPSWNVPDIVKTEDFLPALQADPQALKKKGIELIKYTSDGIETIAPESIDWATMTPETIKSVGMVQNPGNDNALGRIRVLMPNKYNIYLHDTNSPGLFKKDYRALSSGCIRLYEPHKVAKFILANNKGWSDDKVDSYLANEKTVEVTADQRIPVFILYQTIWLDDAGELVYGDDLYGNDAKLVDELRRTGQLSLPANFK